MNDLTLTFQLQKSATEAGYDFVILASEGGTGPSGAGTYIARNIPSALAALQAIREAFTAPLVDKDRLDIMEESTAAIGGLLDRLADVESSLDATRAQLAETNAALVRMMSAQPSRMPAAPVPPTSGPEVYGSGAAERLGAQYAGKTPPPEGPRLVEEGFAGTFRRPLADYVHGNERGHFAGGAFRPGGARAKQGLEPPQAPGIGDDEP